MSFAKGFAAAVADSLDRRDRKEERAEDRKARREDFLFQWGLQRQAAKEDRKYAAGLAAKRSAADNAEWDRRQGALTDKEIAKEKRVEEARVREMSLGMAAEGGSSSGPKKSSSSKKETDPRVAIAALTKQYGMSEEAIVELGAANNPAVYGQLLETIKKNEEEYAEQYGAEAARRFTTQIVADTLSRTIVVSGEEVDVYSPEFLEGVKDVYGELPDFIDTEATKMTVGGIHTTNPPVQKRATGAEINAAYDRVRNKLLDRALQDMDLLNDALKSPDYSTEDKAGFSADVTALQKVITLAEKGSFHGLGQLYGTELWTEEVRFNPNLSDAPAPFQVTPNEEAVEAEAPAVEPDPQPAPTETVEPPIEPVSDVAPVVEDPVSLTSGNSRKDARTGKRIVMSSVEPEAAMTTNRQDKSNARNSLNRTGASDTEPTALEKLKEERRKLRRSNLSHPKIRELNTQIRELESQQNREDK